MRRIYLWALVVIVIAGIAMPITVNPNRAFAEDTATARTTDSLNLRAGPSLSDRVLLVIPNGATIAIRGREQHGFLPVTYSNVRGYASSDYITSITPIATGTTAGTTTDSLNLRSGPSSANPVIMVLPKNASVIVSGRSTNGYLSVTYGSFRGYAHQDWIRLGGAPSATDTAPPPTATGSAVTVDALNLRAGAGTTYTVLAVMPRSASVRLTGKSANGFFQVVYGSKTGWASAQYLTVRSGATPPATAPQPPAPTTPAKTPTPAPPVVSIKGTGVTSDALNMRKGAATSYGVIAVIPARASIALTGRISGTFYQVTWNGKTGWAHKDFITLTDTTTRPTASAKVKEALNLRSGPGTSYRAVLVMPAGATVVLTGQSSGGFRSVQYGGQVGWASATYLAITPASQPQPTLAPTQAPRPTQTPRPTQAPKPTQTPATPPPVPTDPSQYPPISTNMGFHWTNAIVGPVRGNSTQAKDYAKRAGAHRLPEVYNYIDEVYRLAPQLGFDPALIIAQSSLETDNWRSYWWDERLNPAGLDITGHKPTEQESESFANGTIAARAQLAHMHAEVFGSTRPLPPVLQGVDKSYENVFAAGWAGDIKTLQDLAGTWATDPMYGWKIAKRASTIFG